MHACAPDSHKMTSDFLELELTTDVIITFQTKKPGTKFWSSGSTCIHFWTICLAPSKIAADRDSTGHHFSSLTAHTHLKGKFVHSLTP